MPRTYETLVNDHLQSASPLSTTVTEVSWRNPSHSNVKYDYTKLHRYVEKAGLHVDSLAEDMLDVAVTAYVHDRIHKRNPIDLSRGSKITIPVRNRAIWDANKSVVAQCISYLMRDKLELTFTHLPGGQTTAGSFSLEDGRPVCLFSGGADSFAGAVSLLEQGEDPILASHYAGNILGIQRKLAGFLQAGYSGRSVDYFPVGVSLKEDIGDITEQTQWVRSFLFLSIASSLAITVGTKRLRIFENGPIALNVPIAEGRHNTRTAHPYFLDLYHEMIKAIFSVDLDIQNPFLSKTKGELMQDIAASSVVDKLAYTTSCWRMGRSLGLYAYALGGSSKGKTHCGTCYPCVIRQAAFAHSGLTAHDNGYVIDPRAKYPNIDDAAKVTIADFLSFAKTFEAKSANEILTDELPTLSIATSRVNARQSVAVYERFAEEIRSYFRGANTALTTAFSSYL